MRFFFNLQVFGGAVVGATVADDGEQEAEAPAGAVGGDSSLQYQVVGTLKDVQAAKPTWITDIIPVSVFLSFPLLTLVYE